MTWKARTCGENLYHHIYAWGNDRHPVFKEDYHYKKYLWFLRKCSCDHAIDVIAHALMEWHVHLFIHDKDNNLSLFMQNLHGDYAQYYNRETHRTGHVFGERFNNKIVEVNEYGIWLSRYIHRQALEAHLVDNPKDYPWTSYRIYLGLEKSTFLKHNIIMEQFGLEHQAVESYERFVLGNDDGPVDWNDKKISITLVDPILKKVFTEFGVPQKVLISPRGITERRKRQEIIIILHQNFGYKCQQIARAFQISHAAVAKILKKYNLG